MIICMNIISLNLLLLCIFPYFGIIITHSVSYSCKGFDKWEVDFISGNITTQDFQEWLFAWQHSSSICHRGAVSDIQFDSGGVGLYLFSIIPDLFAQSFLQHKAFRPLSPPFFWADVDANECTHNIRSIDCYFESLSNCKLNSDFSSIDFRKTKIGLLFSQSEPMNVCTLAMKTKKSLIWLIGQLIFYTIRMRSDIKEIVDSRVSQVLVNNKAYVIGVHIRTGEPDYGRKVINLDAYMDAIEQKLKSIDIENRDIIIYFACNDNNILKSETYLKNTYGNKYEYKYFISMVNDINTNKEIELELRKNSSISRKQLMIEYLTDILILAKSDLFIGSESSNYGVVSALKHGLGMTRFNPNICYINRDINLVCEPPNTDLVPFLYSRKYFSDGTPI